MYALDRVLSETNARIEGHHNSEKTFTSDFSDTMKNVTSFITHRWSDFMEREIQFADQLRQLPAIVSNRKNRREGIKKRKLREGHQHPKKARKRKKR